MLYFSFIPSVAGCSYTIRRTRVPMLICLLPSMWHWTIGQPCWALFHHIWHRHLMFLPCGIRSTRCSLLLKSPGLLDVYGIAVPTVWIQTRYWECGQFGRESGEERRECVDLKKSSWAREDLENSFRKERRRVGEDGEIPKLLETCWDPSGCFDTNFPVH